MAGAAGTGSSAGHFPVWLSTFVGRERELSEVRRLLAGTRLLTLVGAGGCGKTRLAAEAAAAGRDIFAGVWWVELASLADPAMVGPAVARVIGVQPVSGQADLDALIAFLAPRRALVVLDNCEHVLDASAEIAEALAQGCPSLTVMATSREPLGVAGEVIWRVPSLSLPAHRAEHLASQAVPDLVESSDAVRLFTERATTVRPDFRVTGSNAAAVLQLCRDLDGMPLAIELAAARLQILSVEQIAEGLADRFRLLSGGSKSSIPRHQTLRASVDWSHALLSEAERILFRRLGVFNGSLSLDAAERVGAFGEIRADGVLDLLSSLVAKSLVHAEIHGPVARYRMLETVRQYAFERVEEAGEADEARDRHRDACLDLAERVGSVLLSPRQAELLDRLDLDAGNLAAAIEWAACREPMAAQRLCIALTWWWRLRGYFAEGDAAFSRALETCGSEPSALRARLLWGRAYLAAYAGTADVSLAGSHEALAEAELVGDRATMAAALFVIALLTMFPDPVGAREPAERGRRLAAEAGDDLWLMACTQILAYTYHHQEDSALAISLLEEVLPLAERIGYQESIAWHWSAVGWGHLMSADLAAAREALERANAAARKVGEPVTGLGSTLGLALIQVYAGDPDAALDYLHTSAGEWGRHGGSFMLPWLDWAVATADAAAGRLEAARARFEGPTVAGMAGSAWGVAMVYVGLAQTLRLLGDTGAAEDAAHHGLAVAARIGNGVQQARARLVLGRIAAGREEWSAAQKLLHDALAGMVDTGNRREMLATLEALAEVAAGLESYDESARLLAAAKRARRELGILAWKHEREEVDTLERQLRDTVGEHRFSDATAQGERLSLDDAVGYARRARGRRKRPSAGWESLTPTELEVVRHAAAGLTNLQIADAMFIGAGTVKWYLSNIYAKLGVKNRSELAAMAARRPAADDAPTPATWQG